MAAMLERRSTPFLHLLSHRRITDPNFALECGLEMYDKLQLLGPTHDLSSEFNERETDKLNLTVHSGTSVQLPQSAIEGPHQDCHDHHDHSTSGKSVWSAKTM